jgi:hypothetical protein
VLYRMRILVEERKDAGISVLTLLLYLRAIRKLRSGLDRYRANALVYTKPRRLPSSRPTGSWPENLYTTSGQSPGDFCWIEAALKFRQLGKVGPVGNSAFGGIDEAKLWSMADALRNNMDAAKLLRDRLQNC